MAFETALVFANGDFNDGAMVQRALANWREALIVAADGGARAAAHFGLPLRAVIGDMDSLSAAELSALVEQGVEVYRFPEVKDETDLELALAWVVEHGARRIRVIGAIGDRLDQTLSNVYLLALPILAGLDIRIVAGRQAAWLIGAGEHAIDGAPGDTVSLIPLSGTVPDVRTDGLYYPLRGEALTFGPARGVSNVMQGTTARVRVGAGVLLVVHTIGRA